MKLWGDRDLRGSDAAMWESMSPGVRVLAVEKMRKGSSGVTGAGSFEEELFGHLLNRKVEFLIVGAHALAAHCRPRWTEDLDLFIGPNKPNARRVLRALDAFELNLDLHPEDFLIPGRVVRLGKPPNRIDLMTSLQGITFEEASAAKIEVPFGQYTVPVIGREAFLKSKKTAPREKDLVDVRMLEGNVGE